MARRELVAAVCVLSVLFLSISAFMPDGRTPVFGHINDTTDPIVDYGLNGTKGENGWYKSSVIVWVQVNGTVNYTIDDQEWQPYTEPVEFTVDGNYSMELRGYINETSNETVQFDVKIDRAPPTTIANYTNDTLKVTLVSSDATSGVAKTMYRIDGTNWRTYTGPFRLSAGEHAVQYYSVDFAGNQEAAKTLSVLVPAKVRTFEAGLIIGLLIVGLGAFFFLITRGGRRKTENGAERGGGIETNRK